jgi:hypothetical protein
MSPLPSKKDFADQTIDEGLIFAQHQPKYPNQQSRYNQYTSSDESSSDSYDGTYI